MTFLNGCIIVLLLSGIPGRAQVSVPSKTTGSAPADSADFEQGKQLLAQGLWGQAISAVQRGLKRSPHNLEGLNLLGVIYHQQGKYDEAAAVFHEALAIDPRSIDTLNNLGTSYAAQDKTDAAEQMFRKVLELQPKNSTANYNLGLLLLAQNKPKEAIVYLTRVASPDEAVRLNLVRAYLSAGLTSQGLAVAEKLSQEHAKATKVHFSLGMLLGAHQQYPQAVHELELANALQPEDFDILHDLGRAYLLGGQTEKAQTTLNQALRLQPDSADTLYLLAQTASEMQKDVDALELLVRARKIAPTNTDILFLMARLSMKQSFFEDAIELLNEGLKIDPKRADFHAALGESYFTVGKVDKALQEFKTLISLDPSPRSYVFMGLCHRHLGQYDEAKHYLNLSLSADPNNLPALFNLGFIARKQGDYPQAERYLQRAVRLDKDYPDALFELASLKMDEKKYDEAVPLLRHFVAVSPNPSAGYYKLARSESDLHQLDAAQRDMNIFKTLSKSPQPVPYPLQHFFDYLERRSTLSAEQQNESDLRALQAEVQQHPDRPHSLSLLAEALLKSGQTSEAMEVLKHLDAVSGEDFRTELNTGVLLGRFYLYADAIRYFQAALKTNPSSDDAKYNLGEAFFQSGDYENALQSLLRVSPDGQKQSSYLGLLGDVYTRLGRYEDASRCLQQAITAAPDNDQYYASLGMVQLRADDLEGADHTVRQGLARIPDSGLLYWAAGIVAVVRGHGHDAESLLKKATELSPSREAIAATLGIFYYEEGRFSDAREVLKRCMEMFPERAPDFQKINAVLDAASASGVRKQSEDISPGARREFYELALTISDQEQ